MPRIDIGIWQNATGLVGQTHSYVKRQLIVWVRPTRVVSPTRWNIPSRLVVVSRVLGSRKRAPTQSHWDSKYHMQ